PFGPGGWIIGPIYGACLPCGMIREHADPRRSLSFCADEEADRPPKEKTLRPTRPLAARGISPRERLEPPRQPCGFSMQSARSRGIRVPPPCGVQLLRTSPALSGPSFIERRLCRG